MKFDEIWGICLIIFICLLVLIILFFRNKLTAIIRFVTRGAAGGFLIYGVNSLLIAWGVPLMVGINPLTVLTSAILGIPGVCLLYAVAFI